MTEPLRTAPDGDASADADRDALIERLLLAGLDHYFEGRYEQAVNVWTRVAFLERGHGRARAYIERARGALAERQRESDEFLHRGLDAYRTGDLTVARELLTRAVAEAGHAASATVPDTSTDGTAAFRQPPLRRRTDKPQPARPTNWIATVAVSALMASAILLAAQPIASWLGDQPVAAAVGAPRANDPLPIVRPAEMRLARAKELYEGGRFHDALRLLDAIDRGDALRGDADTLTAAIQTALLATVPAEEAVR
jgi:hypothetical protein